jgi:hypothetical protein
MSPMVALCMQLRLGLGLGLGLPVTGSGRDVGLALGRALG